MSDRPGQVENTDHLDDDKMPLLDHLVELRHRLLHAVAALVVSFLIAFYFAGPIFNFLVAPLADLWHEQTAKRLIYTALHEKFVTEIKVAFFAGTFIAFPIIANQLWKFIAPGLYRQEKRAFLPFLLATPILFFAGGAFVYYFVLPVAWAFFAGFEQAAAGGNLAIELEPKVNEYLSLVMRLIFAFGLSFELPVVLTLLTRSGLATVETLKKKRRYAVVFAFIAAAILTPPDPLSQVALAIPIILLYEISIWCSVLMNLNKRNAEEVEEKIDGET